MRLFLTVAVALFLTAFVTYFPAGMNLSSRIPASTTEVEVANKEQFKSTCAPKLGQFSFKTFDPAIQTINGVQFPREKQVIYRGIKNDWEANPKTFLHSVFGDGTVFYQSWAYSAYRKELLGLNEEDFSKKLHAYFTLHKMEDLFKKYSKCVNKMATPTLKEKEAAFAAAAMIDDSFLRFQKADGIIKRYMDYESKEYIDFSGHAHYGFSETEKVIGRGEMIFGTNSYAQTEMYASTYVMGFYPAKDRATDLNYWNYVKAGNQWIHHPNDTDEFVTPGYFFPNDLVMVEDLGQSLTYLKMTYLGKKVIVLLPRGKSYADLIQKPAIDTWDTINAELRGVIISCGVKAVCSMPKGLVSKFASNKEDQALPEEMILEINENIKKHLPAKTKLFYHAIVPSLIEVKKATYGKVDVTNKASEYCNNKKFCGYKVAQKFLFETKDPNFVGDFSITWKCSDSAASKTESIASPAEEKTLKLQCPL